MANALPDAIGAQAAYPGRQGHLDVGATAACPMLMGDVLTPQTATNCPVKVDCLQE